MKKFFKKFSSYAFWVSLSAAVVILINALGRAFGFSIENKVVEDCIMALAGVLVVLGIVSGKTDGNKNSDENGNEHEIENEDINNE